VYEVEIILLSLGESKRPQQIGVYKSGSEGGFDQLVPWLYLVTDQSECMDEFGVSVKLVPDSENDVLCQSYLTAAADINEQVLSRSRLFVVVIIRSVSFVTCLLHDESL